MSDLVIVETKNSDSDLSRYLKPGRSVCASFDEWTARRLAESGFQAVWLGDYSTVPELEEADQAAVRFARTWYLEESGVSYRGVNLPSIFELSLGTCLIRVLENYTRASNYLTEHPVREVTVICDEKPAVSDSLYWEQGETAAAGIFTSLGCSVRTVIVPAGSEKKNLWDWKNLVRKAGLVIGRWTGASRKLKMPRSGQRKILYCSAIHHIANLVPKILGKANQVYLDESFQLSKMVFARRHSMDYLAAPWLGRLSARQRAERESAVRDIREKMEAVFERRKNDQRFFYRGASIVNLVSEKVSIILDQKISRLTEIIDCFQEFFTVQKIDVVVVDEDVIEFRKCLVSVSKSLGIPSVVLLHASTPSFCKGFDLAPLTADYLVVGGEGLKADCIRWGVPPGKVIPAGILRYDSLGQTDGAKARKNLEANFHIPVDRCLIVLASTYISERLDPRGNWKDLESAYRDFFSAIKMFREATIFIKLYPMDPNPGWIRRIADEEGAKNILISQAYPLTEAMAAADVVLSFYSSAVTESFALGRPTLVLDYLKRISPIDPLASVPGSEFTIRDREHLKEMLGRFIHKDSEAIQQNRHVGREVVSSWAGCIDGHAAERVTDFLCDLAVSSRGVRAA